MTAITLDPDIAPLVAAMADQPQMHQVPIAQLRQVRHRIGADDIHPVGAVRDATVTALGAPARQIPIRLYQPVANGSTPALVIFFHGGGFVFGGIDGYYDHVCRMLCDLTHAVVISVGYRLAPEDKFPAASDDGVEVLRWASTQADALGYAPGQIFIAGGSAGANLAAVTALRARDENICSVRGQVLYYPITRYPDPPTASHIACATGYYLTGADIFWFWQQYLRDAADRTHPYATPVNAGSLAGVAPAFMITAEADPLRDEGEAYAHKLQADGVPIELKRYSGVVHGFMAFPTPKARQAIVDAADWMRRNLG